MEIQPFSATSTTAPIGVWGQKTATEVFDKAREINSKEPQQFKTRLHNGVQYTQSDPLGLMGDAHMYAYAYQNPVKYSDSFGLKTCMVFVIDPWFMVGDTWIGGGYHHVALWMDQDCEGEQFLFDPSGSYQGPGDSNVRGSYGIFSGQEADLDSYKDYHTDGGTNGAIVETICFETDECDQCSIADRAWELGDPRGVFCSATSSACVTGIGPFDDYTSAWPKFFRRHLRKNPDGTSSHP